MGHYSLDVHSGMYEIHTIVDVTPFTLHWGEDWRNSRITWPCKFVLDQCERDDEIFHLWITHTLRQCRGLMERGAEVEIGQSLREYVSKHLNYTSQISRDEWRLVTFVRELLKEPSSLQALAARATVDWFPERMTEGLPNRIKCMLSRCRETLDERCYVPYVATQTANESLELFTLQDTDSTYRLL